MTASEQCKEAGLKSLTELSTITGKSVRTLQNWHRDDSNFFSIVLCGAVMIKKGLLVPPAGLGG